MQNKHIKQRHKFFIQTLLISLTIFCNVAYSSSNVSNKTAYFIALKGGVSLGSYETGINRVLLRYMRGVKTADVVAFSGASAGSLNSILSAIDVCIENKTYIDPSTGKKVDDTVNNNFMKSSWNLGIDELLPGGSNSYKSLYSPKGRKKHNVGIFSRVEFDKKKDVILNLIKRSVTDCELTITMSVTKFVPHDVAIKEIGAYIKMQRFVVGIDVEVKDNRLIFKNSSKNIFNKKNVDIPKEYIQLVENEDGEINFDDVWELGQASSAFPIAFHPVLLTYCMPHELKDKENCHAAVARNDLFSDGGLFDNAPIGVAWDMTAELGAHYKNSRLIYINPDSYRVKNSNNSHKVTDITRIGLSEYTDYFAAALETAHELEYASSLRKIIKDKKDTYFTTNRFHHLLADLHFHFGAFYAEEYRMHDYLVGVYDGEHTIAQLICADDPKLAENRLSPSYQRCVKKEHLNRISIISEMDKDSKDFLLYLYDIEYKTSLVVVKHYGASKNTYIVLNKAFGNPEKNISKTIDYADYVNNLVYFSTELNLKAGSDLDKILNDGSKYTASKISGLYENLIHMQNLSASCTSCDGAEFNDFMLSSLKAVEPISDSYFLHLQSGIWSKPFYESLGFSYGFNARQKNQVLSLEFRPSIDFLAQKNLTIDFSLDYNRFGGELDHDHYLGVSMALVYHTDSILLPTWSLGYQYDGEGAEVYKSDLRSIFIKASFMNEVISLKYLNSLDDIESYPVSTRDNKSIIITIDVSRLIRIGSSW